jgi:hypothetical protein
LISFIKLITDNAARLIIEAHVAKSLIKSIKWIFRIDIYFD